MVLFFFKILPISHEVFLGHLAVDPLEGLLNLQIVRIIHKGSVVFNGSLFITSLGLQFLSGIVRSEQPGITRNKISTSQTECLNTSIESGIRFKRWIIRGFLGDVDIMHVAFPEASIGNADVTGLVL